MSAAANIQTSFLFCNHHPMWEFPKIWKLQLRSGREYPDFFSETQTDLMCCRDPLCRCQWHCRYSPEATLVDESSIGLLKHSKFNTNVRLKSLAKIYTHNVNILAWFWRHFEDTFSSQEAKWACDQRPWSITTALTWNLKKPVLQNEAWLRKLAHIVLQLITTYLTIITTIITTTDTITVVTFTHHLNKKNMCVFCRSHCVLQEALLQGRFPIGGLVALRSIRLY